MFYYCAEVRRAEEEEKRRSCCSPVIQLAAGSGILAVAHLALPKWSPLQGGVIVYQITEKFHRTCQVFVELHGHCDAVLQKRAHLSVESSPPGKSPLKSREGSCCACSFSRKTTLKCRNCQQDGGISSLSRVICGTNQLFQTLLLFAVFFNERLKIYPTAPLLPPQELCTGFGDKWQGWASLETSGHHLASLQGLGYCLDSFVKSL